MGNLAVVAHATESDKIALWVGVRNAAAPPDLRFTVDGRVVQPTRLRGPVGTRTFTSAFHIEGLLPDTRYTVHVDDLKSGEFDSVRTRTLPSQISLGETFRMLLVSCYHRDEDPRTLLRTLDGLFPWDARPNLVLLMGDQVYLDLPTEKDFPKKQADLEPIFEANYIANWFDAGLKTPLRMAPVICCPDDHEFWNNYPDRAPIVQNSWSPEGRAAWEAAARKMYTAFQLAPRAGGLGAGVRIDVPPLSIYVTDTRSTRVAGAKQLVDGGELMRLRHWADSLTPERIGILVTGQSLLADPASQFDGEYVDWELANYAEDYSAITRIVRATAERLRGFFLVTGDVHWGRVATVADARGATLLHEIIASPSSLVTTLGKDTLSEIVGQFTRDPWPRHKDAPPPPAHFARAALGKSFAARKVYGHKGDHVALLEISPHGFGCSARVTYHSLHVPPVPPVARDLQFHRS